MTSTFIHNGILTDSARYRFTKIISVLITAVCNELDTNYYKMLKTNITLYILKNNNKAILKILYW